MRATRVLAVVGGREYRVLVPSPEFLWLGMSDEEQQAFHSPSVAERGRNDRGHWVKIDRSGVERYFRRDVEARLDGRRVIVDAVHGDVVTLATTDRHLAESRDWRGDQYNMWTGTATLGELTEVVETENDIAR